MTDFAKGRNLEQEIHRLRLEIQSVDERREKAELELLQIRKDNECSVAVLRQEKKFAEQRISELVQTNADLLFRLDKTRKELEEKILSLENEVKVTEHRRLELEAGWESRLAKEHEALTYVIDGKQAELLQLQTKCMTLTERFDVIEKERDNYSKALNELKLEVKQRLREDESKLKEGGEEYERILLALNAEKSQLRHSLALAEELESRQQRQIEELTIRVREGETRERTLEAEVQRLSILAAQAKENERQLQLRLNAAAGQAGLRKDDWEAERATLKEALAAMKIEVRNFMFESEVSQ
jgi:chromosome segregation ATPase